MTKMDPPPDLDEKIARQKALRAEHARRMAEEQQELLADLRSRGVDVRGVWDLVNMDTARYREVLPILIEHLREKRHEYSRSTVDGLVRALTTPAARGKANALLASMFEEVDSDGLRWVIGNALSVVASADDLPKLREYFCDPRYGEARNMLGHALVRLEKADATAVLVSQLNDERVTAEVLSALGKVKDVSAMSAVEAYLDHPDSWIRKKARATHRKLARLLNSS